MYPTLSTLSFRKLSPAVALAATLLLGWGGQVRAGYIAPMSMVDDSTASELQASPDGAGSALADGTAAPSDGGKVELLPSKGSRTVLLNPGTRSSGMGGQPDPDEPGAGGSDAQPTLDSRPQCDPSALVGVLFLEEAPRRPLPFPSRLYRPPRRA